MVRSWCPCTFFSQQGISEKDCGAVNMSRIPDSDPPAYLVTVPEGVIGGQHFPVTINGQQLVVTCPPNARPGFKVRIIPNLPSDIIRPPTADAPTGAGPRPSQLFVVEVPEGVQPGAPFAAVAGGVRVFVTCPPNAGPGKHIQIELPLALTQKATITNESAQIKLKYDKDGWTRTVRATDLKFQWLRVDDNRDVDLNKRFNFDKSAYVRKLEFRQGEDPRIRTGILSLVPASEAVVDSKIKSTDDRDLVTYTDLAQAQVKNFDEKVQWFQDICAQLCVEWNEGHMRMNVRRQFLLGDSVDAVMSLSRKDLRKLWRFEFIGEEDIGAGGLAREWFELVCKEIFDPDMGLWMSSTTKQMSMTINPASEWCCEDHLVYYRFLGRVIGKALLDGQLVNGNFTELIYKHMLGWPVEFKDLEGVDADCFRHLKEMQATIERGEDLSSLGLHFKTKDVTGALDEVELVSGGKNIAVTNDNFPEYVESCLRYKLMDCVKPQLNELLLGLFDVIPEPLLTIFDFQELELLMCGLPEIDVEDWKEHTEYAGGYEVIGEDHPTCQWFWEVVTEFDHEMKTRLLQFVTGTSRVPSRGFGVLPGSLGSRHKFMIFGVPLEKRLHPRAHTSFNRLDLPLFGSKEELRDKLTLAVTMPSTGFDIE